MQSNTTLLVRRNGSFFVFRFFLMNLPTGFFEEIVELLLCHSACPKAFANRREDFGKGLLGLGLDQGAKILVRAFAFALAQLFYGLSRSLWESRNLDGLGLWLINQTSQKNSLF